MKKLIVANWKDKLSPAAADRWLRAFADGYSPLPGLEVVLAVPCLMLAGVSGRCKNLQGVQVAAQDVSPFPPGGYTGAMPAVWLKGVAGYVLAGHRERRRYFHENDREVADKVNAALAAGLIPLLCTDEKGVRSQLAALDDDDLARLMLAYTPSEAVSLEIARDPDTIAEQAERFAGLSGGRPVLYGGGVNEDNAGSLIRLGGLAGVMTAAGCLDPACFLRLLENAGQALAADK